VQVGLWSHDYFISVLESGPTVHAIPQVSDCDRSLVNPLDEIPCSASN